MKKLIVLMIVAVLMTSGMAFASELKGKVTAIDGDKVTIEVKSADQLSVGDTVEVEVKEKNKTKKKDAAPAAGNDMLQGC